ncbi:hypothetical protein AMTR_s00046p00219970 [Amborella trichopoda]|uniref:Uncharacterized protein n=1 Tax=Amborella trichopoda TaxID=13333 RepID=U5CXN4_AMBTC|nr:hypothetical protein AMTR_s00046p00219970 [Amborella trichopoda]
MVYKLLMDGNFQCIKRLTYSNLLLLHGFSIHNQHWSGDVTTNYSLLEILPLQIQIYARSQIDVLVVIKLFGPSPSAVCRIDHVSFGTDALIFQVENLKLLILL